MCYHMQAKTAKEPERWQPSRAQKQQVPSAESVPDGSGSGASGRGGNGANGSGGRGRGRHPGGGRGRHPDGGGSQSGGSQLGGGSMHSSRSTGSGDGSGGSGPLRHGLNFDALGGLLRILLRFATARNVCCAPYRGSWHCAAAAGNASCPGMMCLRQSRSYLGADHCGLCLEQVRASR